MTCHESWLLSCESLKISELSTLANVVIKIFQGDTSSVKFPGATAFPSSQMCRQSRQWEENFSS